MYRLRIEGLAPEPLIFEESLITIGRSDSNLVVVKNPRVSGVHGEIVQRSGHYFYRDLGSKNGSLVEREGKQTVVDGHTVREIEIAHGDRLILGDRRNPVILSLWIDQSDEFPGEAGTLMSKRETSTIGILGTLVLENPLTSRQTLGQLFSFFSDLALTREVGALAELLARFLLDLIARNVFVAVYLDTHDGLERAALVTRDPDHTPILTGEKLVAWFPDAFTGRAATAVCLTTNLRSRLCGIEHLAAVPLPAESGSLGAAIVGRKRSFNEFELDLLTLVAHHAALQFQRIDLIERLSLSNLDLARENQALRETLQETLEPPVIIGRSEPIEQVLEQAERVAQSNATVLVLGETGTGKELIARTIHCHSHRRGLPFAAINCAALTQTLLESELFGYRKGAFTGAEQDRMGLFQAADRGTLFLDEIGDMSPALQVKLLRVLESGEVMPVGADAPVRVDVRVIAATNKDLAREVAGGRFRQDLFYRVNVFPIAVPPLRERPEDIPLLVDHFLAWYAAKLGKPVPPVSPDLMIRLSVYHWPGNVRELENEIHRLVVLAQPGEAIGVHWLSERISGADRMTPETGLLKQAQERFESAFIRRALEGHRGNRTKTAKALGISRQALNEKLRKYDLGRHRKAEPDRGGP